MSLPKKTRAGLPPTPLEKAKGHGKPDQIRTCSEVGALTKAAVHGVLYLIRSGCPIPPGVSQSIGPSFAPRSPQTAAEVNCAAKMVNVFSVPGQLLGVAMRAVR